MIWLPAAALWTPTAAYRPIRSAAAVLLVLSWAAAAQAAGDDLRANASPYGVIIGGKGRAPQILDIINDLGASWVRLNCRLADRDHDLKRFLDAGLNLVITFDNSDPANVITNFGTLRQWSRAGFPYKSKAAYQQRIREVLAPLAPALAQGRQIRAQCENEIGDASVNPKSLYWRGTLDQYLTQLDAFHEAVRAVSRAIPVVLTSFPSEALSAVMDTNSVRHSFAVSRLSTLLTRGNYDAADLHFYGCPEDIPAKVAWVKRVMPAGKRWITTENGGPDFRCSSTQLSWKRDLTKFERLQAQQVATRLKGATDAGAEVCLWFSLFDLKGEVDTFNHLGLLDQSVVPPRKKPAYEAFKSFVASQRELP